MNVETNSVGRALALAIAIEQHNGLLFRQWANRFLTYDQNVSQLLLDLANEEHDHEKILSQMFQDRYGTQVPSVMQPKEMKSYLEGLENIKEHFFVVNLMMAKTLLKTVLEIEQYTRKFYADLLNSTSDDELRAIYQRLYKFEQEHEQVLQRRIGLETLH